VRRPAWWIPSRSVVARHSRGRSSKGSALGSLLAWSAPTLTARSIPHYEPTVANITLPYQTNCRPSTYTVSLPSFVNLESELTIIRQNRHLIQYVLLERHHIVASRHRYPSTTSLESPARKRRTIPRDNAPTRRHLIPQIHHSLCTAQSHNSIPTAGAAPGPCLSHERGL
jgi:hypothetical protein